VETLNVDVVMMNDDGNDFGKESVVVVVVKDCVVMNDEDVELMESVHVDFLD
jgi:hypothetical protein